MMNAEDVKELLSGKPEIPEKQTVLSYARKFDYLAVSSGNVIDILTDKDTGIAKMLYTDDKYYWYADEIYYFDKYNLPLKDEFVQHACEKMKKA